MILFLCHKSHQYTVAAWLRRYSEEIRGKFSIMSYQEMSGIPTDATCLIFSDLDRIPESNFSQASSLYDTAVKRGIIVLNNPGSYLGRMSLNASLPSRFRMFRYPIPDDIRFPVFLRREKDHFGAVSPLIQDPAELACWHRKHPDAIVVEFLDTSDQSGIFRKYSAMRIGKRIVPRHLLFSKRWEVKEADLCDASMIEEELSYVRSCTHLEDVEDIFDLANISYGRLDYSFIQGKLQVWEINTNPFMRTDQNIRDAPRREAFRVSARAINDTFKLLALRA